MTAKMPVFPVEFYKHCLKVLDAKAWHSRLAPNEEFVEQDHAECAFIDAGLGKKCENCNLFLTRPFLGRKVDEEFLPLIEKFYRDIEDYDKSCNASTNKTPVQNFKTDLDKDELLGTIAALRYFCNTPKLHDQVSPIVCSKIFNFLGKLETAHWELFGDSNDDAPLCV